MRVHVAVVVLRVAVEMMLRTLLKLMMLLLLVLLVMSWRVVTVE